MRITRRVRTLALGTFAVALLLGGLHLSVAPEIHAQHPARPEQAAHVARVAPPILKGGEGFAGSVRHGVTRGSSSGGAVDGILAASPTSRFEPTLERLVTWGLTCDLDPVSIRDEWDEALAGHWATVCTAMELQDALSLYRLEQEARYLARQQPTALAIDADALGALVSDPLEKVVVYQLQVENRLWGLGEGLEGAHNPDLELPRLIRASDILAEAGAYLAGRILPLER